MGDDRKKDLWAKLLDGVSIESSVGGICNMNHRTPKYALPGIAESLPWHLHTMLFMPAIISLAKLLVK